jgi:hypothetical protein
MDVVTGHLDVQQAAKRLPEEAEEQQTEAVLGLAEAPGEESDDE